jgi:myosin heavy subunit
LLDIFGFECFDENKYEQLLINYTNEKLQKLYLSAVFETEKIEFINEGLREICSKLEYTDKTTPVIILLDNSTTGIPYGIFNKVGDLHKEEDYQKLRSMIDKEFKNNAYIELGRDKDRFVIVHTAKKVLYNATGFIETNEDKMIEDMKNLMNQHLDPQISDIMKKAEAANKGNTIWSKFKIQMADLMEELAESTLAPQKPPPKKPAPAKPPPRNRPGTKPPPPKKEEKPTELCELHFIRCVKPNELKSKTHFIETMVLQQVFYTFFILGTFLCFFLDSVYGSA